MTTTILNKLTTTRPLRTETRPLSIADLEEILGQRPTTEPLPPAPAAPRARATTKLELPSDWRYAAADSDQGCK